jgi:hypothetical protein
MSATTPRRGQWYVRFSIGPIEGAAGPYEERIDALRASETLEVIQCIEEIELWRGLDPLGDAREEQRDREGGSECGTEDFRYK